MAAYNVIKRERFRSGLEDMNFVSWERIRSVQIDSGAWCGEYVYVVVDAQAELMEKMLILSQADRYNEVVSWQRVQDAAVTPQQLFEQAEAMVESGESASMWAAIRHVAMMELSKVDGQNTRDNASALANRVWEVAREHGYEVA